MNLYILRLKTEFSAAHRLVNYPGVCNNIHGHNFKVKIKVAASKLDESGMAIDMLELKQKLQSVVSPYDHTTLNNKAPFNRLNPTSENLAFTFYNKLKKILPVNCRLMEITVQESDAFAVSFSENNQEIP